MENAKDIKEWCEEQWRGRLLNGGYRNVFVQGPGGIQTKAGSQPTYKSKEQKAYEQSPVEAAQSPVEIVPRRRVSHKKAAQAAAILERVPADELTAFLARFGLSLSLAASIASLDNVEQIARQFLRATL